MARVLFFAILAMCLVCMIQASPTGSEGATTERNLIDEVGAALNAAYDNMRKGAESLANDPTLKKLGEDTAKLIQDGAEAVRVQAAKMIPQTA